MRLHKVYTGKGCPVEVQEYEDRYDLTINIPQFFTSDREDEIDVYYENEGLTIDSFLLLDRLEFSKGPIQSAEMKSFSVNDGVISVTMRKDE